MSRHESVSHRLDRSGQSGAPRYVALSYDHSIVDGLEAVQFRVKVKEFIEERGTCWSRVRVTIRTRASWWRLSF